MACFKNSADDGVKGSIDISVCRMDQSGDLFLQGYTLLHEIHEETFYRSFNSAHYISAGSNSINSSFQFTILYIKKETRILTNLNDLIDFFFVAGYRGLEVRGHGSGSYVSVDLCDCVRGGHPGPVSPASFPESGYSQPGPQLGHSSHMTFKKED